VEIRGKKTPFLIEIGVFYFILFYCEFFYVAKVAIILTKIKPNLVLDNLRILLFWLPIKYRNLKIFIKIFTIETPKNDFSYFF